MAHYSDSDMNAALNRLFPTQYECPERGVEVNDLIDAAQGIASPDTVRRVDAACLAEPGLAKGYLRHRKGFAEIRRLHANPLLPPLFRLTRRFRRDPVLAAQWEASLARQREIEGDTVPRVQAVRRERLLLVSGLALGFLTILLVRPSSTQDAVGSIRGIGDGTPLPSRKISTIDAANMVFEPKLDQKEDQLRPMIFELRSRYEKAPKNTALRALLIQLYSRAEKSPILPSEDRTNFGTERRKLEEKGP